MVNESDAPATVGTSVVVEPDTLALVESRRNHPLYLHPSDTPGCVLTTVQLTGAENYALWSRSMVINLRAKSKLGFVLGTCRRTDYAPELEEQWERCNAFVLAWIMNTVSKELLSGIVYASDAETVWADLKERFDKVDGSRIYQLHREICTIHQGNSNVSAYFTKIRLMWDEFDALVPPPSCSCDKSRVYVDHMRYLRLFAFLMGLNEVYSHARSQILMMNPLPSVSKAYAMILADESQRSTSEMHTGNHMGEATALYAGRGNFNSRNTRNDGNRGELNTGRGGNYAKKKVNWNLFCDHCKMHGHTRDICFKLIGYPDDWKFKKKSGHEEYGATNLGRGMNGNKGKSIANNVQIENGAEDLKHDAFGDKSVGSSGMQSSNSLHSVRTNLQALAMRQSYTPTQYQKIMQLLAEEEEEYAEVANMAGYPPMVADDLPYSSLSSALDGARLVYTDGVLHEAALVVAQEAHQRSLPIVIDAERKIEGLDELLHLATYIVCSTRFPQQAICSGDVQPEEVDIDDLFENMKQSIDTTSTMPTCKTSEVAKQHAKGIGTVCGRLLVGTVEKIPSSKIVDTTGAGDAFVGAVLYSLCANFPPEKMLMFASQVAAIGCSALGARAGLPHLTDPCFSPFLA